MHSIMSFPCALACREAHLQALQKFELPKVATATFHVRQIFLYTKHMGIKQMSVSCPAHPENQFKEVWRLNGSHLYVHISAELVEVHMTAYISISSCIVACVYCIFLMWLSSSPAQHAS